MASEALLAAVTCKTCGSTERCPNGAGHTRCKPCHKRQKAADYYSDPSRAKRRSKEWKERRRALAKERGEHYRTWRPSRMMYKAAQARAREKGLPFTIEESDIVIPTHCPVLGIELKHGRGCTARNSPTLDRIRPDLGYVPGNIAVISHMANAIKSDADSSTVFRVAVWMLEQGV